MATLPIFARILYFSLPCRTRGKGMSPIIPFITSHPGTM